MSSSRLNDTETLATAMSNSIQLSGKDLDFIKAMLKHMTPVSKSLSNLIIEGNSYEQQMKRNNQILDD
jgi:predicted nuclease of predicted toxin-antitoxin system